MLKRITALLAILVAAWIAWQVLILSTQQENNREIGAHTLPKDIPTEGILMLGLSFLFEALK